MEENVVVYRKKIPPTDISLSETLLESGWSKLKEPKNLFTAVLLSVPFMILNVAIVAFIVPPIRALFTDITGHFSSGGISFNINLVLIIAGLLAVFILLVVHEMLHAVLIPNFIKSKKTFWGITPFGGFVSTTEEISKMRFILISTFPFIILSIVLPLFLYLIGIYNGFITFLVLLNAAASSVDILNVLLVIFQVPGKSNIISNGFETFHKSYE